MSLSQRDTDAILLLLAPCWNDPEAKDGEHRIFQRRFRVSID